MEHKKVHVIAMCWVQDEILFLENWPGGGRIVFLMIVCRPTPDHTAAFVDKVSIKVRKTLNLETLVYWHSYKSNKFENIEI